MAGTRADIGPEIATRGGVNVEHFYGDIEPLRKQAELVLDATKGYRHMLGDSNPPTPPYPWRSIQTVIDAVRDRGKLLE